MSGVEQAKPIEASPSHVFGSQAHDSPHIGQIDKGELAV